MRTIELPRATWVDRLNAFINDPTIQASRRRGHSPLAKSTSGRPSEWVMRCCARPTAPIDPSQHPFRLEPEAWQHVANQLDARSQIGRAVSHRSALEFSSATSGSPGNAWRVDMPLTPAQ